MRIRVWSSDVCSSYRRLEVDQLEARQHAGLHRRLEALLDAVNEFARDRTAGDGVLEGEAGTRLLRLKHQLDAGELTGAAGLLLVGVVDLRAPGDGLAVGDQIGRASGKGRVCTYG